ncbi:MAG TPA: non-reducing end alpha-L-arabinofuranosidase family hydrolase [Roseiflexaceae bacterium]|nr:non-reducing end alpha-L-arabinofuranosidase family hydrolase [Roseiflexaceae bacterium]
MESTVNARFTRFSTKLVLLLALLGALVLAATPASQAAPMAAPMAAPNPNPTWYVDPPILYRAKAEPYDHYAVKDPTIVYSGGRYHMFYTGANASGGWQMLYSSATTLEGFRTAPHIYLSKIGESYFCAPEVFYFEPHRLWYLIYQDGTHGAAYATTSNIADPNSWSGPKPLGASGNMGWDYYVICDDANCYMYNTPSDGSGRIYVRRTTLANFPTGWGAPSVAVTDTFEGVNVYRSIADGQYYLVVEDMKDNRYYELWTSSSAGGPWRQVAEKWAWRGNLVYNADRWTTSVSHGDILRPGVNQKLEISDINRVDFLIQGTLNLSGPYQQIPWDLGIIRNYSNGTTPSPTPVTGVKRMQSYNFQSRYLRHQGYRARIDENVSPFEDSQFRVVPGLANSGAISFESVNFPGRYLRHRNNEIWLDANDGTAGFRADATWNRRAGLANSGWSSYESYNLPGQYLRHSNYLMILGAVSGSLQQADATFREQ